MRGNNLFLRSISFPIMKSTEECNVKHVTRCCFAGDHMWTRVRPAEVYMCALRWGHSQFHGTLLWSLENGHIK